MMRPIARWIVAIASALAIALILGWAARRQLQIDVCLDDGGR